MKHLAKICGLSLLTASLFTAGVAAADPIVLRAGHDSPETVPVAKGLAKWAQFS